ncbi:MAG: hypothetical protein M3O07_08975, partial [Pseudomonadota bacterium]|nr:hypothetical protein [Pseudomonadota bacterium]
LARRVRASALRSRRIVNRLDYGIRWSQVLDNGSLVVDNNVQIELQFEALRQGPKKGAAE